ncbi:MAG TPA: phage integrase N-terminal SAM-like domain-containing protein [Anaerolineales bacterium]|nr:phage integrase N-terminal SAM-like domain-containing protein [Anaerolineales bacterium]
MKIGSMKEALLSHAKETFLFDCRVAGLDPQTRRAYCEVLDSFIYFTGNILVKELTPDHVRMYIANLSDGPNEGEEHTRTVIGCYAVIHTWVRWLCAQKFVTQRNSSFVKPPRLTDLFPAQLTRSLTYCE